MRIHFIINDYSLNTGGAQRIVRNLHAGLQNCGTESYILGLTDHADHELPGARSLGLSSPYRMRRAMMGIRAYAQEYIQPGDLVHAHLFPTIFYLSLLKTLGSVPCPMICTEHNTSNRRRGKLWGKALDTITYLGYDRIIAISKGTRNQLIHWKPNVEPLVTVINNGVKLHFSTFQERKPTEPMTVVSVGRLHRQKNYDTVLQVINLLKDIDFIYAIAGRGPEMDNLQSLRDELGLTSKIKFLGYDENVPELLASADIFLIPSRWEGFGLAAVEAMNASLPVLASDVPGLREIVACDPPCALLVDPCDSPSIAESLRQLLLSPDLRQSLGKNAFQRAQNFSQERMFEEHLNLYAELIQS